MFYFLKINSSRSFPKIPLWEQMGQILQKRTLALIQVSCHKLFERMKDEKTIFKPLAGIEPHIFGLLVRRVNHYTTRTNHAGNAAS